MSSQKKSFLTAPNFKNKRGSSYETLESTDEMELMNFVCTISLNFEIISSTSHAKWFLVLFQQIFIFNFFSAFRKCRKDCNIVKTILTGTRFFCPVKIEIA